MQNGIQTEFTVHTDEVPEFRWTIVNKVDKRD